MEQMILKAVVGHRIVGSVRACMDQGECKIGKLMVHPDFQNRGIGAMLMNEIEQRFSHCNKYILFTGAKSSKNLYLYKKLGYHKIDENQINDQLTLFYLEKKSNQ
ncbi:putative acetyltransferase [compost metagenome]